MVGSGSFLSGAIDLWIPVVYRIQIDSNDVIRVVIWFGRVLDSTH